MVVKIFVELSFGRLKVKRLGFGVVELIFVVVKKVEFKLMIVFYGFLVVIDNIEDLYMWFFFYINMSKLEGLE